MKFACFLLDDEIRTSSPYPASGHLLSPDLGGEWTSTTFTGKHLIPHRTENKIDCGNPDNLKIFVATCDSLCSEPTVGLGATMGDVQHPMCIVEGVGGRNVVRKTQRTVVTLNCRARRFLCGNSTQLNSTQLNSTQLNSTQLNSTQLNSTEPGTLICEKTAELQFWPTSEGRFRTDVRLTNTGGGAVRIYHVIPSCGCTNVKFENVVLQPGESQSLTIEINSDIASSTAMRYDYAAGKVWLQAGFKLRGNFHYGNARGECFLNCSGTYILPVTVTHGASDLGEFSTTSARIVKQVLLKHTVPVSDVTVKSFSPGLTVRLESSESSGHLMQLLADPNILQKRHPDRERLELLVSLGVRLASGEHLTVPFPFRLRLVPPVSVQPHRLVIGPVPQGEKILGSVRLRPDGRTIRQLRSVTINATDCTAQVRHTTPEGDVFKVDLEFNSLATGLHSLNLPLVVQHDDGTEEKSQTVVIPVTVVVR